MLNIGPQELLLILLVALVVVGPRKLPEIGRSIGKGIRELRKAQDEVRKTIKVELEEDRATSTRRPTPLPDASSTADGEGPAAADPGTVSGGDVAAAAASGADDMSEVSRSLGRGIAELRRARKDIQRTFRVDLTEPRPTPPSSTRASSPPAEAEKADGTHEDTPGDLTGSPPE
jgi:TatA/E family protein of Tat protein translocase